MQRCVKTPSRSAKGLNSRGAAAPVRLEEEAMCLLTALPRVFTQAKVTDDEAEAPSGEATHPPPPLHPGAIQST